MAARRAVAGASPAAASHERSECLAAGPKEPGSLSGIPYSWDSVSAPEGWIGAELRYLGFFAP